MHRAQQAYPVSERRACRVLRHARATQRYESVKDDQAAPRGRIKQLAGEHVTWGYLRVWVRLRREGWLVNKKRVHRLYKLEGLCVGRHKLRRHRSAMTRPEGTKATRVNESWSMDFMADQLFDGRKFRLLTLVDDFSRESLAIEADQHLTAERVVEVLDRVGRSRGLPAKIRVDNGSEFTGRVLDLGAVADHHRVPSDLPVVQHGLPAFALVADPVDDPHRAEPGASFLLRVHAVGQQAHTPIRSFDHRGCANCSEIPHAAGTGEEQPPRF